MTIYLRKYNGGIKVLYFVLQYLQNFDFKICIYPTLVNDNLFFKCERCSQLFNRAGHILHNLYINGCILRPHLNVSDSIL